MFQRDCDGPIPPPTMDDPKGIWFRDENALREAVLDLSPELRHDTKHLADILSQMVDLERIKRGLDNPRGSITLEFNKHKSGFKDPDLTGSGTVAGRHYRALAWKRGDHLNIALEISRRTGSYGQQ